MKKLRISLIVGCLLLPFFTLDWHSSGFNRSALTTLHRLSLAALTPDLTVIPIGLSGLLVTIAYATTSIGLSLVIGLSLGTLASGVVGFPKWLQYTVKDLLAGMRAVHELIWALFFVAAIGLSPFAAVWAVAIPYGGMLGKIFSEILVNVSDIRVDALTQLGASRWQRFFYVYLPEAYGDLVSYSLYRYECAIRSSTVLSFVGVAGIGLQIQLTLQDMKLHQMMTYIYMLVLLISFLDHWGTRYRQGRANRQIIHGLFAILSLASWSFVLLENYHIGIRSKNNLGYMIDFFRKMLGIDKEIPAFADPTEIMTVLRHALDTLQMSWLAIILASLMMLVLIVPASRNYGHQWVAPIIKAIYLFTRAIPELIWAMIAVFVLKAGIFAGAVALAIHNFGILGKLCTEVIEELPNEPLYSLKQSGANNRQLLFYGILPLAYKRIVGYIIYRWEIILRTTIVVGIAGAGGLGYYFRTSLSWFHYTKVTLVLIVFYVMVKVADWLTASLRKKLL